MVVGLGSAWILDGLQITIASSVTGVLIQPDTLDMSSTEVGLIASVYLVGQVVGALVFGRLSDQLGRKRLLIVTLLLYLFGTGLAAFTVAGCGSPTSTGRGSSRAWESAGSTPPSTPRSTR
jgi:MFS family permease